MDEAHQPENRLAAEASLYLRQHARNPVDWWPWTPGALAEARRLDRPIFLSIGYSACHWCHVMERESFEDPEVARLLNDHFVPIKVDREERPDLDQIYMAAVQALTGQGGWPMSVFLTPELKPFYGGTYFPPNDHYGRPSFRRVLIAVIDAWQNRRAETRTSSDQIAAHLRDATALPPCSGDLDAGLIRGAVAQLGRAFDDVHGGFGRAPKFPHALEMRLLLRAWNRFGDDHSLHMATVTLDRMAAGGMYDQLGGGFHRYSTDARWLVPHFEKMLYDNALLTSAYVEGFQATGNARYREVVEETLEYVQREMTAPEGGFYSTQDADSEGVEGKYYVWSADEIGGVLGADLADLFAEAYGVSAEGNWEGANILHGARTPSLLARLRGLQEEQVRDQLANARRRLLDVRASRVPPARDEKVLTAWNGLMIAAFAEASAAFSHSEYAETAARAADFLLTQMRPGGVLLRTWTAGRESRPVAGYLEDYAFLANGLVSLYEATFELRWIEAALELAEQMIGRFWDESDAGFYFTAGDHDGLISRGKDSHDASTPSGNSMAMTALLRLASLTGREDLRRRAEATLQRFRGVMEQLPTASAQTLCALDFFLGPVNEFAVVGDPAAQETRRVVAAIYSAFRPDKVVAMKSSAAGGRVDELIPLLAGKTAQGAVTTYVCRGFTCQAPLVGADSAVAALGAAGPHSDSGQASPITSSET